MNAILQEIFLMMVERDLMDGRDGPSPILKRLVQLMKAQGLNPKAYLLAQKDNFPNIVARFRELGVDHNWSEKNGG